MKKIKIIKVIYNTSYDHYGEAIDTSIILKDESVPWIEVDEETYKILTSEEAKQYFKYNHRSRECHEYIIIEDVIQYNSKINDFKEKTLDEHIKNIKKEYELAQKRQAQIEANKKKAEKARLAAKEKIKQKRIQKAKELLKEAGEI